MDSKVVPTTVITGPSFFSGTASDLKCGVISPAMSFLTYSVTASTVNSPSYRYLTPSSSSTAKPITVTVLMEAACTPKNSSTVDVSSVSLSTATKMHSPRNSFATWRAVASTSAASSLEKNSSSCLEMPLLKILSAFFSLKGITSGSLLAFTKPSNSFLSIAPSNRTFPPSNSFSMIAEETLTSFNAATSAVVVCMKVMSSLADATAM
mmetsp:Transcript_19946/g.33500  ORF Transcript_19946/g.33500 Transcript_19946/m.33500 type:complete len:208 (-) Transcript_19946:704-1327(-)